jgi:hypothetical protein
MNYEAILWYVLFLDSIIACFIALGFLDWYRKKLPRVNTIFPVTLGWSATYLTITIWLGWTLLRINVLPW